MFESLGSAFSSLSYSASALSYDPFWAYFCADSRVLRFFGVKARGGSSLAAAKTSKVPGGPRYVCLSASSDLLLNASGGANVNQQTEYGWTPLLTAVNNRNYRLAALFVERGADANIANKGGWTPLYLATDNSNGRILRVSPGK